MPDFPRANIRVAIETHSQTGSETTEEQTAAHTDVWIGSRDADWPADYNDSFIWAVGSAVGSVLIQFFGTPEEMRYALMAATATCEEHIESVEKKAQKTECQKNQQ